MAEAGVVAVAAVADGEVEQPVRPKGHAPAVMVEGGHVNFEQHALAASGVVRRERELGEACGVVEIGRHARPQGRAVVGVEFPVRAELGMRRESAQPAFVEGVGVVVRQAAREIENWFLREFSTLVQQINLAELVGHEAAPAINRDERGGGDEVFRHELERRFRSGESERRNKRGERERVEYFGVHDAECSGKCFQENKKPDSPRIAGGSCRHRLGLPGEIRG